MKMESMRKDSSKENWKNMTSPDQTQIPLQNSPQAKTSFGIALFNVVYFFLLHAVIEAFLLGGRATPGEVLGAGLKILYYVLPPVGMLFCIFGVLIAWKDLRLPFRSREFSLMGFVINLVILAGLIILLALTIVMG